MKLRQWVALATISILSACNDSSSTNSTPPISTQQAAHPDRQYVSEHNYIKTTQSEKRKYNDGIDRSVIADFPQYYVYKAKEWPREDLNDASSYDMPRIDFTWSNLVKEDEGYDKYEGRGKIWSMKTDGTDLRLVTDKLTGKQKYRMARSPNNRYLAYGHLTSEGYVRAVFDLKEQKTHVIYTGSGYGKFLWAEDSSYLYFTKYRRETFKWEVETGQISPVKLYVNESSVIIDGIRYSLGNAGLGIWNETTQEKQRTLSWRHGLDRKQANATATSISPDGTKAWANNSYFGFEIDVEKSDIKIHEKSTYDMSTMLGYKGWFGSYKSVSTMRVTDYRNDVTWWWHPLGTGRSKELPHLYNSVANDGLWFKKAGEE
ncbi:hypothetical protein N9R79_06425 [Vibrio sp.]|nr:hypothetical protein [Vibrio sp.]